LTEYSNAPLLPMQSLPLWRRHRSAREFRRSRGDPRLRRTAQGSGYASGPKSAATPEPALPARLRGVGSPCGRAFGHTAARVYAPRHLRWRRNSTALRRVVPRDAWGTRRNRHAFRICARQARLCGVSQWPGVHGRRGPEAGALALGGERVPPDQKQLRALCGVGALWREPQRAGGAVARSSCLGIARSEVGIAPECFGSENERATRTRSGLIGRQGIGNNQRTEITSSQGLNCARKAYFRLTHATPWPD